MTRTTTTQDDEESLTKVDVGTLTDHEIREVIPACDYVVVGYDSSYSDKDESTIRVNDPVYSGNSHRAGTVRGPIRGDDADRDDRQVGFGKGPIRFSTSSGRVGSTLWVGYPAPKPDKTRYTVTFRSLAGNWSKSRKTDIDDPDYVNELVEATVDKYSYDNVEAPPEDERFVEDVEVDVDRPQRRVTVDVPVTLVIADDDTMDVEEVVERARQHIDRANWSNYDTADYRDDLPEIGDHMVERESSFDRDLNLRESVRYWIIDTEVESERVTDED